MNEKAPFYMRFPILQIFFAIFWIPVGALIFDFILLGALVNFCISIITLAAMFVINQFMPDAMYLYVLSGRMDALMKTFSIITIIFYDFLILVLVIELINKLVQKKLQEKSYGDRLKDVKNQIIFKKTDNTI